MLNIHNLIFKIIILLKITPLQLNVKIKTKFLSEKKKKEFNTQTSRVKSTVQLEIINSGPYQLMSEHSNLIISITLCMM